MRRRRCRRYQRREVAILSSVASSRLRFERIQKRRHTGGASEAEQHQAEVKGKNQMRNRQQNPSQRATAQIRQNALGSLIERKRRIVQAQALDESAHEQEKNH